MKVKDLKKILEKCNEDDQVTILCGHDGWETSNIAAGKYVREPNTLFVAWNVHGTDNMFDEKL